MIGLSSFLALILGATLWMVLRDEEYVAPAPSPSASAVRPAEAAATLEVLARAVRRRDQGAAAALAAAGDPAALRGLRGLVRNATALRMRDFDLRYVDEVGGADADGEWRAVAGMTWRFTGFDREVSSADVEVRFAQAEGEVGIVALGGPSNRQPTWLGSRVHVRRTPETLVVAARRADAYSQLARQAVRVVRRVLPGWRSGLVVEVPPTAGRLDRALAAGAGTYANVAGVTAAPDGDAAAGTSAHVFLNPERMSGLSRQGAQVVVSHEAAHVALGATESALPVWLTEGMADYIALRDVRLPLSTTASQIIAQVRREGPPRVLPGDDDFDDDSEYFGATYEAAWLACRLLAQRAGEKVLLGFYRRADGSTDLAGLFQETFGLSLRRFTGEWRRALSDLAA